MCAWHAISRRDADERDPGTGGCGPSWAATVGLAQNEQYQFSLFKPIFNWPEFESTNRKSSLTQKILNKI
jgi:hypothetical protein